MLVSNLKNDLITAMKDGNVSTVSCLRYILAEIHNREIDLQAIDKSLDDQEVQAIITKEIKKRQESSSLYQQQGRSDLADKEDAEVRLLSNYLPQQLEDEEIVNLIKQLTIQEKLTNPGDFGKLMGLVMGQIKGRADGNRVSLLVKQILME